MLNASGMLGNIDRTPAAPGSPIIHFRPEDLAAGGGATWENVGSGGSTYDGTWSATVGYYNFRNGFNAIYVEGQNLQLASEYALPSQCMIGMVIIQNGGGPILLRGSTHSNSYWMVDALQDHRIYNSAGSYVTATDSSFEISPHRLIFERTGSTAGEVLRDNVSKGALTLSGSYYVGNVLDPSAGGVTVAEVVIYPSNAVTPAELDAYFCEKFVLTP